MPNPLLFLSFAAFCNVEKIDTLVKDEWRDYYSAVKLRRDSLIQTFSREEDRIFPNPDARPNMDSVAWLVELGRRIQLLNAAVNNLDHLKKSAQVYTLRYTKGNHPGGTQYDLTYDKVVFFIREGNVSSFVHETTHGEQFENGGIIYRRIDQRVRDSLRQEKKDSLTGGIGNSYYGEIEAYQRQFAFDPHEVIGLDTTAKITSLAGITPLWLMRLQWNHRHIYSIGDSVGNLAILPVNVNSDMDFIARAYPTIPGLDVCDCTPLKKKSDYLFKQNKHTDFMRQGTWHFPPATPSSPPQSRSPTHRY